MMSPAKPALGDELDPSAPPIRVLCVDDNQQVADAVRIMVEHAGGFVWRGWLPAADDLVSAVRQECPDIVILDVDMPGLSPFDALEQMAASCPEARAVMFSGHVRFDLIERAFAAGAWGYVSKSDGETALINAVRAVRNGEIALSAEARSLYGEP